jgi:hypothetical protein
MDGLQWLGRMLARFLEKPVADAHAHFRPIQHSWQDRKSATQTSEAATESSGHPVPSSVSKQSDLRIDINRNMR